MHWLEKWRKEMQCSREQLAKEVGCSEYLIWILENQRKGVTHKNIANRIAEITGATVKQRDSLVHKKHRGTWQPPTKQTATRKAEINSSPKQQSEDEHRIAWKCSGFRRPVLQINLECKPVVRFESMREAAESICHPPTFVADRCRGKLKGNEFEPLGYTFRYEDEWNAEAAKALMPTAQRAKEQRATGVVKFGNTYYITLDGETKPLYQWEEETGLRSATIIRRIARGMSIKDALSEPDMRGRKKQNEHA